VAERRREGGVPQDEADPEWVTYKEKISHSTDSEDSIKWRLDFVLRHLLESFSDLSTKDNQREFTWPQRLAIFSDEIGEFANSGFGAKAAAKIAGEQQERCVAIWRGATQRTPSRRHLAARLNFG